MDIIIKPDRPPGPAVPNHPGETSLYDPRVAQDHTDLKFLAKPRRGWKSGDPLTDASVLMTKPTFLECPGDGCKSREFRILADDSADASAGLVQIICGKCRVLWPVVELRQPQVNDLLAQRLGLIIPDLRIQTTLGDDDD